jgi:dCTP deaminase
VLSDVDIAVAFAERHIDISPYDEDQLQPCSYDVRLDDTFLLFETGTHTHIDPKIEHPTKRVVVQRDDAFVLHPGEFVLGSTAELLTLDETVTSRLEGKSSLGRLGLLTHATAGFIDAGFSGHITLELANVATLPLKLWPGMKIGQLCFFDLTTPSRRPYGSMRNHYQGQRGPTASKAHLQFEEDVS